LKKSWDLVWRVKRGRMGLEMWVFWFLAAIDEWEEWVVRE
jgi:hypothetical protein